MFMWIDLIIESGALPLAIVANREPWLLVLLVSATLVELNFEESYCVVSLEIFLSSEVIIDSRRSVSLVGVDECLLGAGDKGLRRGGATLGVSVLVWSLRLVVKWGAGVVTALMELVGACCRGTLVLGVLAATIMLAFCSFVKNVLETIEEIIEFIISLSSRNM
jgi:hypothetical protein